ncbi:MAG: flavodoxin [Clostridia bacterium]|nr:flavodoxin [Clostridia bacterium]
MKVAVIYWSGTGNTEAMAKAIGEGITEAGGEAIVKTVSKATLEDVLQADAVALGSPSMGSEVLEEDEFEPFIANLKGQPVVGKVAGAFGSYDWGDGQWMRDFVARLGDYGFKVVGDGLIIQLTPDGEGLEKCRDYGKAIVAAGK